MTKPIRYKLIATILGILLKLSSRVAMILTAITVAVLISISGKPPITVYENFVLGTLFSLGIFYVFIDAGIKSCNAFRQGREHHTDSIQRTANSHR